MLLVTLAFRTKTTIKPQGNGHIWLIVNFRHVQKKVLSQEPAVSTVVSVFLFFFSGEEDPWKEKGHFPREVSSPRGTQSRVKEASVPKK